MNREALAELIRARDVDALVVLSAHPGDPESAPFVRGGRLGLCLVIATSNEIWLAYASDMERDEALRSALNLLTPKRLGVDPTRPPTGPTLGRWVLRALRAAGVSPGRIALAGSPPAGEALAASSALLSAGFEPVSGHSLLQLIRKRKSVEEVAEIAQVAASSNRAFHALAQCLAGATVDDGELWSGGERLRVQNLRALVDREFQSRGLTQPEGGILAPAEEAAAPHSVGTPDRVLRAHESLVVDLFPKGRLFSDCTRTFCVGRPSEALRAAHAATQRCLEQVLTELEVGVAGWHLQRVAQDHFEAAGYATAHSTPGTTQGYVHGLGHGVGYELHELPSFREETDSSGRLEAGDVITIEPGLYSEEQGFGVRLEELLVLEDSADRYRLLTPLPRALDPREWLD